MELCLGTDAKELVKKSAVPCMFIFDVVRKESRDLG
jgi:hypothetical protein